MAAVITAAQLLFFGGFGAPQHDRPLWEELPRSAVTAVAALLGQLLVGRFLERTTAAELGWRRARLRDLGSGFALGAVVQGLVLVAMVLPGWYTRTTENDAPLGGGGLVGSVLLFLCVAVFEETFTRGILYRQIERGLGSWAALGVTALFFGLGHFGNPGATWFSGLAIAIEAGVLLAGAYALTRSMWLPIGLHWAWNLFEGPVFGEAVSGTHGPHWLAAKITGPALWTGGVFGPEGGLVTVLPCTALGVAFVVLAAKRGHMTTPPWMRRRFGRAPEPQAELASPPQPQSLR
jgi:membrane protease YdiL (CAAX protease family)